MGHPLVQVLIGVGHATQLGIDSPKAGLHIITLGTSSIFFCLRQLSPRECKEKGSKGRRLPKHQWSLDVALVNLEYTCVLGYFLCCKEIDYKKQPSNPIWPIKTIHYPKEHRVEKMLVTLAIEVSILHNVLMYSTQNTDTGDINVL